MKARFFCLLRVSIPAELGDLQGSFFMHGVDVSEWDRGKRPNIERRAQIVVIKPRQDHAGSGKIMRIGRGNTKSK